MLEYRLKNVGAQYNAPLRFYGLFLLLFLPWSLRVDAKIEIVHPPCRVDTSVVLLWCAGDTIHMAGQIFYSPGSFVVSMQGSLGCDSVVHLWLQSNPDTPRISQHPSSLYIRYGDTGVFNASTSVGTNCSWQRRMGVGVWMDVQADSFHSNPLLPNLQVVAQGGDSTPHYRYNCLGCLVAASSNPAELMVYPPQSPISVHLSNVESCLGVNTQIAVRVNHWQSVGRIALDLFLPSSSLQLVQWSTRIPGLSLATQGDTVKIRKTTTIPAIPASGDTMLVLVVRPLIPGAIPLTWLIPDSGRFGLQFVDPNTSWVHRLSLLNGQIFVPSQAAQVLQEPGNGSVQAGDSVSFVAVCANTTSYRWQIRTGTTWRNLVDLGVYSGTQTAVLRLNTTPDSLNNARFRLIAFGTCGLHDTSRIVDLRVAPRAPAIRLTMPHVVACTSGQYAVSIHVDSFNHVAAFTLRFMFNQDSIQYASSDYLHPLLVAGGQMILQPGAITLNWFGPQPLQLGSAELLRLRFQVFGSSSLEWDTTAQGTSVWSPYQQHLQKNTESGSIVLGPLPATLGPIPCLFVGDAPVTLSAWPLGGTFSGVGVQGQLLYVDSSPGPKTIQYQANYQGCLYVGQSTYEVFPAPALSWTSIREVCSGTPVSLTARMGPDVIWSTGDTSATISLYPTTDTMLWVQYQSAAGCVHTDSVRIRVRTGPNARVDDTLYYYNNNSGPIQLRASGGVTYRWHPAAGLSDSLAAAPLATPDTTTVYTVIVSDTMGCSRSLRVVVVRPRINPSSNGVICRGDSIRLSAPVLYSHQPYSGFQAQLTAPSLIYLWQPAAGLDNPNSSGPMASPGNTTLYQVRVIVAQSCTLVAHRGVFVRPAPRLEIGWDSISTSVGNSVQLMTHVWDTTSPVLYHWSPGTGLSDSTQPRPWASPLSTTTYTLKVRSGNGCIASDTIVVVVTSAGQGRVLQGQLIYDNDDQTPIREGTVTLEPMIPPQPTPRTNQARFKRKLKNCS